MAPKCLGQTLDDHHHVAGAADVASAPSGSDAGAAAARSLVGQALHSAVEDLRLAGHGLVAAAEARRGAREAGHLFDALAILSGLLRLPCGALLEEARVRAAVHVEASVLERQHAVDRIVEQRDVVGDHEDARARRPQELHDPCLGVEVEVVGGLVEDQQLATGVEQSGELQAPALPAREHPDVAVELSLAEPHAGGDAAHLSLGLVAAQRGEALLER